MNITSTNLQLLDEKTTEQSVELLPNLSFSENIDNGLSAQTEYPVEINALNGAVFNGSTFEIYLKPGPSILAGVYYLEIESKDSIDLLAENTALPQDINLTPGIDSTIFLKTKENTSTPVQFTLLLKDPENNLIAKSYPFIIL